MAIFNSFSIVFELFMHGRIFHSSEINFTSQGDFTKTKSTTINLVAFLYKFVI
jgi:hypothetical protein